MELQLELGVKTDPTQYRYSYPWLFRLLAEEGVACVQLGTFFELYQLPDEYFVQLRRQAEDAGVRIESLFTAHRELGGFFVDDPGWESVARRNYQRLIEIGALLGAHSVGSNPGAVYRDRMGTKPAGLQRYLRHLKELMHYAYQSGVPWLTIEPMSCLAEPPTLPGEIVAMGEELAAYHRLHPESTAQVGYCADVAHGYADAGRTVRCDHLDLLRPTLPYLYELHLKNTDSSYCSTFGFAETERAKGIVDIEPIRQVLLENAEKLPVRRLVGYLEIGGPKLGRDYSDQDLAEQLRASLAHLKRAWSSGQSESAGSAKPNAVPAVPRPQPAVRVAPSLMCADLCHLEASLRQLESAGADLIHLDVADGHFVPNLLLGLDVIRQVRAGTALPLDVHLMVENPEQYIEPLAEIGVDWCAIHVEAARHLDRLLSRIRDRGMKAGAALNPATPLGWLEYVLPRLDFVLLLTVNPGFAGQQLAAGAIPKIADCRRFLDQRGCKLPIVVDGNVSFEHIPKMVVAGADVLVAGTSSWFHRGGSILENAKKTLEAIERGTGNSRE